MTTPPIGVITRDRVSYLDVTLKSLSATRLPDNVSVTIFDDDSVLASTAHYYFMDEPVRVDRVWPKWDDSLGLSEVVQAAGSIQGIDGRVPIHCFEDEPHGVVNASCRAISWLFDEHPKTPGVFLLQDDVVFNVDWYERMCNVASDRKLFSKKPLGLLAGLKLNTKLRFNKPSRVVETGVTAQCLYITRRVFDVLKDGYFSRRHTINQRFDDTLRRQVAEAGFWAGTVYPYCCQHIGAVSLVRPWRKWTTFSKGRVGYYAKPPYVCANSVRTFA